MKYRKWLPVIALLLAVVLMWAFFHGRGQRTWENIHHSRLMFEEGLERTDSNYGKMNTGPALSVGGGRYTLSWDIETDADNVIRIASTNQAAISPSEIVIEAGKPQGSATFISLDEIYDLQIVVDYQAGSHIRVNRMDLTGHQKTNGLFTLTFVLLGAAALFALHACGWLTPQRSGSLMIIAAAVLLSSMPDLSKELSNGHDAGFHMGRVLNMVHALRAGQFPVRLGTYMQNGYGAALSAFYPDLFLYPLAFIVMLGGTLTYSFHVLFIAMNLTSALTMWYAAFRLFKSNTAGVGASVLYTLSQYRLMDIYTRFAVGEALAMCFLPLFALGLYEVLWGDKRRWKLLALSAAMICQSHLITTAVCGVIALGVGVLSVVHVIRDRRVGTVIKAIAAAALLCAFFFAPMYTYSRQQVITDLMMRDLADEAVALAQIFVMPNGHVEINNPELSTSAIGLGLPVFLSAVAAAYAALKREKRDRSDVLALLFCAAGAAFTLAATTLVPWGRLSNITGGLVDYIQFPWRFLTFASLLFAFAGGYALMRLGGEDNAAHQFALLALCAVCAMPLLSDETRENGYIPADTLPHWDQRFADYALIHANLRALDVREPLTSEGVLVEDFVKFGSSITAHVSAQQDGTVVMPLYAFDGYVAELDGEAIAIERNETDHMLIPLAQGMQGELSIRFEGKGYWKVFDCISLAALLGMIGLSAADLKRKKA